MTEENKKSKEVDENVLSLEEAEAEARLREAEVDSEDPDVLEADRGAGNEDATEEDAYIVPGVPLKSFNLLTNKNRQFILNVDKQLGDQISVGVKEPVYHEMVETLIDGQQSSQTARQLYGTPTEAAKLIVSQGIEDPQKVYSRSPDWQIALDGGLMLGSIYTLITGVSLLSEQGADSGTFMGLITLIINYLVAAWAMLAISKSMPDLEAPKGKKGMWKYILVSVVAMLAWFLIVVSSAVVIPPQFNPTFTAPVYLIIGAVTVALRFYLKKKLNIQGSIF